MTTALPLPPVVAHFLDFVATHPLERLLLEYVGLLFIAAGVFFCFVGVLGTLRLPDVYSRLHASGKVGTLGLVGILIGTALLLPNTAFKVIALGIFLLVTAPLAAHVIAAAAHRQGVPLADGARDDLAVHRTATDAPTAAEPTAPDRP